MKIPAVLAHPLGSPENVYIVAFVGNAAAIVTHGDGSLTSEALVDLTVECGQFGCTFETPTAPA